VPMAPLMTNISFGNLSKNKLPIFTSNFPQGSKEGGLRMSRQLDQATIW